MWGESAFWDAELCREINFPGAMACETSQWVKAAAVKQGDSDTSDPHGIRREPISLSCLLTSTPPGKKYVSVFFFFKSWWLCSGQDHVLDITHWKKNTQLYNLNSILSRHVFAVHLFVPAAPFLCRRDKSIAYMLLKQGPWMLFCSSVSMFPVSVSLYVILDFCTFPCILPGLWVVLLKTDSDPELHSQVKDANS